MEGPRSFRFHDESWWETRYATSKERTLIRTERAFSQNGRHAASKQRTLFHNVSRNWTRAGCVLVCEMGTIGSEVKQTDLVVYSPIRTSVCSPIRTSAPSPCLAVAHVSASIRHAWARSSSMSDSSCLAIHLLNHERYRRPSCYGAFVNTRAHQEATQRLQRHHMRIPQLWRQSQTNDDPEREQSLMC